jgi:primase-polymerase (primpol)-like protein
LSTPTTWSTFERACEFASTDGLAGVGFVFNGDGIVGIDLDACVNDGEPEPWALEIISQFNS